MHDHDLSPTQNAGTCRTYLTGLRALQAWLDLANEAGVSLDHILSSDLLLVVTAYHLILDQRLNLTSFRSGNTIVITANSLSVTVTK